MAGRGDGIALNEWIAVVGTCMGQRDRIQLQLQGQVGVYNEEAGWGLVADKLPRGGIRAGEDSC